MATEQSVWAKVAALEMSIAAVEQEQERVEAAIRSRASVFALPDRLRHFVVGTVDDPHQVKNVETTWPTKKSNDCFQQQHNNKQSFDNPDIILSTRCHYIGEPF